MTISVRDAGTFKLATPYVRDAGAWKAVQAGWVKEGGVWKQMFSATAARPNPGDAYQGGFYVGQINDGGVVYDLIAASKSGGEATLQWDGGSGTGTTGRSSRTNGPANSDLGANPNFPAHKFCFDLVLNGFSDWYLPAVDELEIAYRGSKPTTTTNDVTAGQNANSVPPGSTYTGSNPSQTSVLAFRAGGAEAFSTAIPYWTSTEVASSTAIRLRFDIGTQQETSKTTAYPVRAFRRVAA